MSATLADIQRKYGDSVYPLYKDQMHEPYMEQASGKGYQGVILYDEKKDCVQCGECGGWFKSMASHLKFKHDTNPTQYKEKFGLLKKAALVSRKVSKKQSDTMRELIGNRTIETGARNLPRDVESVNYARAKAKLAFKSIGHKNKKGLCDAQIASRLAIVSAQVGDRKVTSADMRIYDSKLLNYLNTKYGGLENTCRALEVDISGIGGHNKMEDVQIIAKLRDFVMEKRRLPKIRELSAKNNLICWETITGHFGSWRRAKMMAGLDQLLEEVRNN